MLSSGIDNLEPLDKKLSLSTCLPVSGTSVGLIILLICSIDCKSGDKPTEH